MNSSIGQILINSKDLFDFYAPKYVRTELFRHQEKIKKITNLTDKEFLEIYELIIKNVTLLNHSILPEKDFNIAYDYCKNIDVDDTFLLVFQNI